MDSFNYISIILISPFKGFKLFIYDELLIDTN